MMCPAAAVDYYGERRRSLKQSRNLKHTVKVAVGGI